MYDEGFIHYIRAQRRCFYTFLQSKYWAADVRIGPYPASWCAYAFVLFALQAFASQSTICDVEVAAVEALAQTVCP